MLRVCINCLIPKSPDEFYYNPSRTDRLQTRCIPCYIEVQRTYYYAKTQRKPSKPRGKPKLDPRICIVCLKPFTRHPKEARNRFLKRQTCRPECHSILRQKITSQHISKEVVEVGPRICLVCTQSFIRRPKEPRKHFLQRKTCSQECQRLLKPKPETQRHTCTYIECQKLFIPGKGSTLYCSRQCRRLAKAYDLMARGEQLCRLCQSTYSLYNFPKSKKHSTGYDTRCKACHAHRLKNFLVENPDYYRLRKPKTPKTPAERKVYRRQQYLKHRAKHAAQDRKWRQTHPEHIARQRQVKHARKMGAPVVEKVDRLAIYVRDKWICQLCFTKVRRRDASLDHVIPLSKGGEHSARNLVLAHKSCNSMKGNRVVTQQMRLFG